MAIASMSLCNFTVFDMIEIDFCDGINVFIGENGTGKTHLLKVLYASCGSKYQIPIETTNRHKMFDLYLANCFQTNDIFSLIRRVNSINAYPLQIFVISTSGNVEYIIRSSDVDPVNGYMAYAFEKLIIPAVYISAKDMLTHGGLEKDFIDRNLPFDITLIDILNKAGVSTIKKLAEDKLVILNKIAGVIGGKVLYKNDRYYTEKSDGTLIDFAAEAEGFKKLGLLYRLIETGHLEEDSVLIWDEPEANLNPKLIPDLVEIILTLEQAGVQMFFATHDYFFAKFLEVRKKKDSKVLYHALYKKGNEVSCESQSDFALLENNSILRQSIDLYKEEVMKVME